MLDWSKPGPKYEEMAKEFLSLMGIKSGHYPIINRKDHPQQWREWYAYYGFRRLFASQAMMRDKDEKTVPTLSPFDFDAEFNPGGHLPEVPRGGDGGNWRPPTAEEKKRVEIMMRRLWAGTLDKEAAE